MEFLYMLERIRVPGLNEFMEIITHLGAETAFLVTALVVFWCVSKRQGYYILSVGFVGTIVNQFLKLWFRIPRPFELDPDFQCLPSAKPGATGFSFPSGHTQSSVGTFGGIANSTKKKWMRIVAIVIAVLVPFSRMYVGVHTPQDVVVAAVIALLLIFAFKPIVYNHDGKYFPVLLVAMSVLSIGYLCFVELYQFPENVNIERLESGIESAYTLLGALLGLILVYYVDKKWIQFPTKAVWWAQILKVLFGLVIVLAVKEGLRTPLNWMLDEKIGRLIRYFLIVVVAGSVWPLSFNYFSRLGSKE